MNRRRAWLASFCLVACANGPPRARLSAPLAAPAAPPKKAVPSTGFEYRVLPQALLKYKSGAFGTQGLLVEGHRCLPDGTLIDFLGSPTLDRAFAWPLVGGVGVGFWSKNVIYRAAAFNGPLSEVTALPYRITAVTPHALGLLVSAGEHWLLKIPPSGAPEIAPTHLADSIANDAGQGLALTLDGKLTYTSDRGVTWSTVDLRRVVYGLGLTGSHITAFAGDLSVVFEADGSLSRNYEHSASPGKPTTTPVIDTMWLERAYAGGFEFPSGVLLFDRNSSRVVELDPSTFSKVWTSEVPPLEGAAPQDSCSPLRAEGELWLVCRDIAKGDRPTIKIYTGYLNHSPKLMYAIGGTALVVGSQNKFVAGDCKRDVPGFICVYSSGDWIARDYRTLLSKHALSSEVFWVPASSGQVLGFVPGKPWSVIDTASGQVALLPSTITNDLQVLRAPALNPVRDAWFVDDRQVLRVETPNGQVAIALDGKSKPQGWHFDQFCRREGHWLGLKGRSLWQSIDAGATFLQVRQALDSAAPRGCGDLGALFPRAIRMGWPERGVAQSMPEHPVTLPWKIDCTSQGEPVVREDPERLAQGQKNRTSMDDVWLPPFKPSMPILTDEALPLAEGSPRGAAAGSSIWGRIYRRRPPGLGSLAHLMDPFEDRSEIREVAIALRPALPGETREEQQQLGEPHSAIPVGRWDSDEPQGWLTPVNDLQWLLISGKGKLARWLKHPDDMTTDGMAVQAATQLPNGHLAALVSGRVDHVVDFDAAGTAVATRVTVTGSPEGGSSLVVLGTDQHGQLGLLRLTTERYENWRFSVGTGVRAWNESPGKPLERLASWDSLLPADHADCGVAPDDIRATFSTHGNWFRVFLDGDPLLASSNERNSTHLSVRWNARRVCLIALSFPYGVVMRGEERELLQWQAVTWFDKARNPNSLLHETAYGRESHQPMACKLDTGH